MKRDRVWTKPLVFMEEVPMEELSQLDGSMVWYKTPGLHNMVGPFTVVMSWKYLAAGNLPGATCLGGREVTLKNRNGVCRPLSIIEKERKKKGGKLTNIKFFRLLGSDEFDITEKGESNASADRDRYLQDRADAGR